jgi:hypothetical protein
MNGYTKKADSSVFKIEKAKNEESIFCHQDA